ncbi:MAG: O-antigen ligase family protein [Prevotella sp.]|nr:O-antigen ligase family protein [Prevotella sp.]
MEIKAKFLLSNAFMWTLLLFAVSVAFTLLSMVADDSEASLWGLHYSYYMLPLFAVNWLVIFRYGSFIGWKSQSVIMLGWMLFVSLNVLAISSNKAIDLVKVNLWGSAYFASYCLSRLYPDFIYRLSKCFLVIFIIGFIIYIQGKVYQTHNAAMGIETSSNGIYCLLTVIPWLMFLHNKKLVLLLLSVAFITTVFSNKRAAMLMVLFIMLPSFQHVLNEVESKWVSRTIAFLFALGFVFVAYLVGEEFVGGRLIERFNTIESTGGSGRLEIWTRVWKAFGSLHWSEQLMGHGHYTVRSLGVASAAHNDFLDVLYDYGILGLILYVILHIYFLYRMCKLYTKKSDYFIPYTCMWMIFFVMSMVSILMVQQRYLIYMAVFWGAIEGDIYSRELYKEVRKQIVP